MASTNPNPGFVVESWILYGIGVVLCALRLTSQVRRLGIKNLQADDYTVIFGVLWYTVLCVAFNQMLEGAGSNLMTPEEVAALTPDTTAERVRGSKWVFVTEHAMLLTIWSMKVALLLLYARLTSGITNQRRMVRLVAGWTACGFIGDLLALYLICRPVQQYWAVPVSNPQCSTYQYYQIVNAVFNISTDIFIFLLGLPPIFKTKLSGVQKAVLVVVFGMGMFVIVAAVLRAIYCIVPALVSYVYMNWYFREASVAVYVTMLPFTWSLLRDVFPQLRSFGTGNRSTNGKSTSRYSVRPHSSGAKWRGIPRSQHPTSSSAYSLKHFPKQPSTTVVEADFDRNGDDAIPGDDCSTTSIHGHAAEIRRDVTVTLEYGPDASTESRRPTWPSTF